MARSYTFGVTLISSRCWPSWASANSLDSSCLLRASRSADLSRERSQVLDRGCANFGELRQREVRRNPNPRTPVNRPPGNASGHPGGIIYVAIAWEMNASWQEEGGFCC